MAWERRVAAREKKIEHEAIVWSILLLTTLFEHFNGLEVFQS
jgi:hypothetical protein